MNEKQIAVGEPVIFIDECRRRIPALVQCAHGDVHYHEGEISSVPCINLVFVSLDANRQDSYGRQIEHKTSISHHSSQSPAVGFCWYWPHEEVVIDEANIATRR